MEKIKNCNITYRDIENFSYLREGITVFYKQWEEITGNTEQEVLEFFANLWYKEKQLYPDPFFLFAGLDNSPEETKAWIVGQDPYPNGEGIGYAFAIKENVKEPKSFKILKEAFARYNILLDRNLMPWRLAKINSINIMPVVKPSQPNSFPELKKFMIKIVRNHQDMYNVPVFAFGNVAYDALREAGVKITAKFMHPAARTLNIDNYSESLKPLVSFIKQQVDLEEDITDRNVEQIYKDMQTTPEEETFYKSTYIYEINNKKFIMQSREGWI